MEATTTENAAVVAEERAHSALSPSRFPALIACGFYAPDGKPSEAATRGTEAHKVLSWYLDRAAAGLLDWRDDDALKRAARFPSVPADDVQRALDCAGWVADDIGMTEEVKPYLLVEQKLTIAKGIWGYADAIYRDANGMLTVMDFKLFPAGEKDYWAQLAAYASAAMREHGETEARMVINAGDYVRVRLVTKAQADALITMVYASVFAAEHGHCDPRPNPWCKYCRHAGACSAQTAVVERAEPGEMVSAQWASMDENAKTRALNLASICEDYAEMVKSLAKADAIAGVAHFPGWKLQTRKGVRRIESMEHCLTSLQAHGVPADAIEKARKIAPGDARDLLKGAGLKGKDLESALDEFCYRAPDCVSLVRSSKED